MHYPHYFVEGGGMGGDGEGLLEVGDEGAEDVGVGFAVYYLLLPAEAGKRQLCFIPMWVPKQLLRHNAKSLITMFPQLGGIRVRDESGVEAVGRDDAAVEFIISERRSGTAFIREEGCRRERSAEMGERV